MTYRVADILEYADFRDEFINQIGKYNINILNAIKDLYIYDFGIFIEVAPDEEERAQLEQNIQMALSKGDINLEDAIDIREIKNLKLANQLLKLKRKSKQEREEKLMAQQQAMQAQAQQQSQQMAGQMAMQQLQMETQSKMQLKQAEIAFEIEKMKNTEQSKLINQRKNNLPPLTFESNEDSLDGFDLAEFEPR